MLINLSNIYSKYNMKNKGVVHIGAHYGEEVFDYLNKGIQEIILFEPLSENFNILSQNMKDVNANIQGYQVALGNDEKMVTMNISSNHALSSSILKPKDHLEHHPDVFFNGTEEVEMKKLDSFNIGDANFINMDVQGYELEVLKGGSKTLKQIDYVYCEVNRGEMYENNAMIEDIDEFLAPYAFERVETYWPETWYKWGDALYIKNK